MILPPKLPPVRWTTTRKGVAVIEIRLNLHPGALADFEARLPARLADKVGDAAEIVGRVDRDGPHPFVVLQGALTQVNRELLLQAVINLAKDCRAHERRAVEADNLDAIVGMLDTGLRGETASDSLL